MNRKKRKLEFIRFRNKVNRREEVFLIQKVSKELLKKMDIQDILTIDHKQHLNKKIKRNYDYEITANYGIEEGDLMRNLLTFKIGLTKIL
jgi:hypothetical protein